MMRGFGSGGALVIVMHYALTMMAPSKDKTALLGKWDLA